MAGKLYGVGVGPGDPELLTLKALRLINEADVIMVPGEEVEESLAYKIVKDHIRDPHLRKIAAVSMPMTKDSKVLEANHRNAANEVEEYLDEDKTVAFLTLGDPTIYSTYIYVHKLVEKDGYNTEIISGITSFCAASARLNEGLVEKEQMLHVVPSSYGIEDALRLPGTRVLMKAGSKMPQIKQMLKETNGKIAMVENCGMENEKVYLSPEEIDERAGYYSLIIIKEAERLG
ncbi:precorrin-2 C(20)-methyltransferase [Parasporobacterium paucivorans]|uniref:Precorrin-2/cobalt-factor-2 C20-methyltransferase n=1 Tax=Parasporobacterium paucivorans DSM 15970 TaxID=1122934 RepID=A0A1M6DT51_9FIRM|nr:precorrin-2 C(20)-methyltransferase [Parasporobacterium paucivorans]SHI76391.1 precorrin-2/cobalt-factor-2 C20-methyltransferase [Parasporobacterium paucivorans DSM 15970]